MRHVCGSLALFVFEKVLVGLTDEETLLNEEKVKMTVVKIAKIMKGMLLELITLRLISLSRRMLPHLPKMLDYLCTMSFLSFVRINKCCTVVTLKHSMGGGFAQNRLEFSVFQR